MARRRGRTERSEVSPCRPGSRSTPRPRICCSATAKAPLTTILATDIEFHEELPKVFPHFPQAKDLLFGEPSVRERSAVLNGALQVGYFILGVRAAGLAAGPMTGFDADGLGKEFFPEGDHRVLAVVNIGRPGENAWVARNPRLEYEEVVTSV